MAGSILMIHGVGGTAAAFDRLAPAFRALGWRVETPTFRPDKRVASNPPADLPRLTLADYIAASADAARALLAETGVAPVLMGHSLGGLVVQKLAEQGHGRAAVLVTPASPADVVGKPALSQAITFANILFSGKPETKSHKIWPFGFSYGVLNKVARSRHAEIFAGTVYESGRIYEAVAWPDKDPTRSSYVDESQIKIPMLVIGAGQDRATPLAGVRQVAAKYARIGAELKVYPDNAHWIVDEPGTDKVIADIAAWLTGKGVTAETAKAPAVAKAAPAKAKAPAGKAPATKAPVAKAPKTTAPAVAPVKAAAKPKAATAAKPATPAKAAPVKAAPVKAAPVKAAPATAAKAAPKPASKVPAPAKAPAAKAAPVKAAPPAKPVAKPVAKAAATPKTAPLAKAPATPAAKPAAAPAKTAAKAASPKSEPKSPPAKAAKAPAPKAAAKPVAAAKPAAKAAPAKAAAAKAGPKPAAKSTPKPKPAKPKG
jgi:pimeloyl-ACP methyl ester carboxylesterase